MNETDYSIIIDGLSKKFTRSLKKSLIYGASDVAKSLVKIKATNSSLRDSEFWALQDINIKIKKGETVGIIGSNGSGKSTLLRVISGILPPDKGEIQINGSVGSLIAVGAGFHPHMTGRQNIYLNGSILGMTKKEIDEKFDDICNFADIDGFLDAPVSTYSSGMRVRLGFAIAINKKPEVLLVDEVLSVGDLSFRNKSLRKMSELHQSANTIIFISHNLDQIRNLCSRTIILEKGRVVFDGDTHTAIAKYQENSRAKRVSDLKKEANNQDNEEADKELEIIEYKTNCDKDFKIDVTAPLILECTIKVNSPINELSCSMGVLSEEDYKTCFWVVSNDKNKFAISNLKKGKTYKITVEIEKHNLSPGAYIPNISIRNSETYETYERILAESSFQISDKNLTLLERGILRVHESWSVKEV